ncbi:c-type cytochrome [Novosphingobium resinovorum]
MCHTTNTGGANKLGPNLAGVSGRKAGSIPGFRYSPAMAKAA